MRHLISALAVIAMWFSFSAEAVEIKEILKSDSLNILEIPVEENTILDLIDYYDAGRKVSAKNVFGGYVSIDTLSGDFASISISSVSLYQLALIKHKKDTLLVKNHVIKIGENGISKISFFKTDLTPFDGKKIFREVKLNEFINIPKERKEDFASLLQNINIEYVFYEIDPATKKISARHRLKTFLSKDDYMRIAPYITDSIKASNY